MIKVTHKGYVVGCDARTPDGYKKLIQFRETKNFWVTIDGQKYCKCDGYPIGNWPVYRLDLDTIEALEKAR